MPTDMSEKGLETLIINSLINDSGYAPGDSKDYDREHAIDLAKLIEFVKATQPKAFEALLLGADTPKRTKFLRRLQGEIARRGVTAISFAAKNKTAVTLRPRWPLPLLPSNRRGIPTKRR